MGDTFASIYLNVHFFFLKLLQNTNRKYEIILLLLKELSVTKKMLVKQPKNVLHESERSENKNVW